MRNRAAGEYIETKEDEMTRTLPRSRRLLLLSLLGFGLGTAQVGLAVPVGEGMGLQFGQFDMMFPSATPQPFSGYGLAAVDFDLLTARTGISSGFLNIRTDAGWVVQNMVIDAASGLPGLGSMFNLGVAAGTPVTALTVKADFSATPTDRFEGTPDTTFTRLDRPTYNAQGRGAEFGAPPLAPVTPDISWVVGGLTKALWGGNRPSVEQDTNQCGPGSVANSLQWLENTQGVRVPHDHVPGIDGKPANSLVGQIDVAMGRAPHMPVSDANFMKGKLGYIGDNVVNRSIVFKHWGGTFVPGDVTVVTKNGDRTSHDQSKDGKTLIQWIIAEIGNREDVELALGAVGGGTGHWVDVIGAGTTLGIDWIAWTHDANQGYESDGTTSRNGGVNWWDGGYQFSPIVNGRPQFFLTGMKMDFAVSESVPEPGTLGLTALALAVLGLVRRRSRISAATP